jgi:hypothetical protein
MRDQLNKTALVQRCIDPVDGNGATTVGPSATTGIATAGYEEALIVVYLGVTAATADIVVKQSTATNGTYAAITGATMTLVGTDDGRVYVGRLNLTQCSGFLRVESTQSAAAGTIAVIVILSSGRVLPEAQTVTTSTKVFDVAA